MPEEREQIKVTMYEIHEIFLHSSDPFHDTVKSKAMNQQKQNSAARLEDHEGDRLLVFGSRKQEIRIKMSLQIETQPSIIVPFAQSNRNYLYTFIDISNGGF